MVASPLSFQDADFRHGFARCQSRFEGPSRRWVPFGMPRLNPNFSRCVFFLFKRDPVSGELRAAPEGTGFLVAVKGSWGATPYQHLYAVTCAHVAPQGASVIRINTNDGKSRLIDLQPDDWTLAKNGADIAAVDITDRIDAADDVRHLTPAWFVTSGFISSVGLGVGEDGFMLGLFTKHPGRERNLVSARFGNISLLAHDDEAISWSGRAPRPAHLFDIRSRGGFSGSPVFIYRTPGGDLREVGDGVRRRTTKPPIPQHDERDMRSMLSDWHLELDMEDNLFIKLLGIHAAQYPEEVEVRKEKKSAPRSEVGEWIKDGDRLKIPGGVTIVVPSEEILSLLHDAKFVEQRLQRESDDSGPVPESDASGGAEPPTTSENPRHAEDFRRLVSAAARTKPPADQT